MYAITLSQYYRAGAGWMRLAAKGNSGAEVNGRKKMRNGDRTEYRVETAKKGERRAEDPVKRAVLLGHDTDTTACVTGGLAGILYGRTGIPKRWLQMLRERERAEALLAQLWRKE